MAIASVGTIGNGVSSTSSSSFTLTTTTNALSTSGDLAILSVATDNITTTDGATNDHTSVTGGTGTWTKLGEYTNGEGAAAAGVTTSLWLFQSTGTNAIGTVFTINLSGAVVDKASTGFKYTVGAGNSLQPSATEVGIATDASNGYGSASFSGLSSLSRLYVRALGKEANTTTNITASTSFTRFGAQVRSRNNAAAIACTGEFRINTSTGETSNPTLAVSGDTAAVFAALEEYTPSGAQTLTPSLFTNTNTFYGPTVSAGSVDLAPSLFTNTNTFFAATISQGTTLSPSLYTNTQTFYAPAITVGGVSLAPGLFTNTNSFFAPAVSRGAVTLTPALFTNGQTFFAPALSFTLKPSLYTNSQTFYAPTVSQAGQTLAPSLFTNSQTFYSPTVSVGAATVLPSLFTNTNTFFSHQISGGVIAPSVEQGFIRNFAANFTA